MRVLNPHNHKWEPGIVKCNTQAPRSYMVTMANGSTLRRNRSHLRPAGEKICIQSNNPVMNYQHPWINPIATRPAPYQMKVSLRVNRPHWPLKHLPVHHSWEVQLQKPLSADPQGLWSPLTDWTYKLNKHLLLIYIFFFFLFKSLVVCWPPRSVVFIIIIITIIIIIIIIIIFVIILVC